MLKAAGRAAATACSAAATVAAARAPASAPAARSRRHASVKDDPVGVKSEAACILSRILSRILFPTRVKPRRRIATFARCFEPWSKLADKSQRDDVGQVGVEVRLVGT